MPPAPVTLPASYTSASCFVCHGANGEGNSLGPDLLHPSVGYATYIVRNGRSGTAMTAYSTSSITDADLVQLFAYFQAQPRATTGEGLYNDLCKTCHGAEGMNGRAPKAAKGAAPAAITAIVRAGHSGMDYGNEEYMPAWSTAELSDAELQLIITYLQ
jgi:mono/diheme cytochrome c family protein